MDMMQTGLYMILVPTAIIAATSMGIMLYVMLRDTVNAYRNRNIIQIAGFVLAWCFFIGVALVIGSVV